MERTPPLSLSPAVWQSLLFEWLWVYHGPVPRVALWSKAITVPAGWFWVETGQVRIQAEGQEFVVKAGQSFFSAPGIRCQWFAEGTRLLSAGFRCQWPNGTSVFQAGLNRVASRSQTQALHGATVRLFQEVHASKNEVTYHEGLTAGSRSINDWARHEAAYRAWFCVYLRTVEKLGIHAQPHSSAHDRRLGALLKAINEWPLDQALKLDRLAVDPGLGSRRIHDLLRAHLGMTAQAWLEQRRLQSARQALVEEDIAFKELAFRLGFRHPPHFTAWFKRHTRQTPTAYRAGSGMTAA